MANLQRCSKCKSEQEIKYFSINKKGQHYKTCDHCRNKRQQSQPEAPQTKPFIRNFISSISIDATDIATLLGLHRYQTNLFELVMKYWKRGFTTDFLEIREELVERDIEFVEVPKADEKILEFCEQKSIPINFEFLEDVEKLEEQLQKEESLDIDAEDVVSFCNKQMGIQFEKKAIEMYEETCNSQVKDVSKHVKVDEPRKYVLKQFRENDKCKWSVGGRVDGTISNDKIIEVKHRKNRLFERVPIYEILQVYTYMYAMDIYQASVIEMYNGEQKITDFTYTVGYEQYVLQKLNNFCDFMENFIDNYDLKQRFMSCSMDDTVEVNDINKLLVKELKLKHISQIQITPIIDQITNSETLQNTDEPKEELTMVFDVEHSGRSDSQVLQLSWGIYTNNGTCLSMKDYYVKPEGFIDINPHVSKKIHLTYEELVEKQNALPVKELLELFLSDVAKSSLLVAHNMSADERTMNTEFRRHGLPKWNIKTYCTMTSTKGYCGLKDSRDRPKPPSLQELYSKLFEYEMDMSKAHNSGYDVECCAKCYFAVKDWA